MKNLDNSLKIQQNTSKTQEQIEKKLKVSANPPSLLAEKRANNKACIMAMFVIGQLKYSSIWIRKVVAFFSKFKRFIWPPTSVPFSDLLPLRLPLPASPSLIMSNILGD